MQLILGSTNAKAAELLAGSLILTERLENVDLRGVIPQKSD